ncbi:MAG: mercury methylation ferredoxin HgcB [bacterium]
MVQKSAINTLEYDQSLCSGCGMCATVCPHAVFAMDGRKARLADPDACMECGACQVNCPAGAIKVDSGVGCAAAMIWAALRGRKEPVCGCSEGDDGGSSGCCS